MHNWDVLNWAVNAPPVRAMAMGRNDLFRDRQPDRDVHDYYSGVVEYPGNVFVNIIHSWVAPTKFNEEYTRLIGTKGGVDFNSGTFSYRPDQKKPDQKLGGPETQQHAARARGLRQLGAHPQRAGLHRRARPRRRPRLPARP